MQLIEAIERFETIRRVLGHSLVLDERLSARLRSFAAASCERDTLARYARLLGGLRTHEEWWNSQVGYRVGFSTLPTVDLEAEIIRHETCHGNTVVSVHRDGDEWTLRIERPNEAMNPASGRDLALVWCAGVDARALYPSRRHPTSGAAVEAVAILALCNLNDLQILQVAKGLDIKAAWQEIGRLRRPRYLLGLGLYWRAWDVRHPDSDEPPPSDDEVALWLDAQRGAGLSVIPAPLRPARLQRGRPASN